MNKKWTTVLASLCVACTVAGFAACGGGGDTPPAVTYSLDTTTFNNKVVYGEAVDYDNLVVKGSDGSSTTVTLDMISGANTDSVGAKVLNVSYAGTTMKVNYTVYYEVTFVVDGDEVDTQLVLSADEIHVPDAYLDAEWNPAIPDTMSDNMTFTKKDENAPTVSVAFNSADSLALYVDNAGTLGFTATSGASLEVTTSNDNVKVQRAGNLLAVQGVKAGVTTITLTARGANVATAEKTVIVKPTAMTINQSARTYGDENVLTLGSKDVRGAASTFALSVSAGASGKVANDFNEYLVWESDHSTAHIDEQGVITLGAGEGVSMVSFKAKFVVDGEVYGETTAFAIRCVWNGVTVSNYEDLYQATKAQKEIVLQGNIDFPTNVNDIHYDLVNSTYDTTFYANANRIQDAKIKTLLQFRNDVYGNGYTINAHNATLGLLDSTGKPTSETLFKGPLNFVALTEQGSSIISVKGQDNVCFAVYENVTLKNVQLYGSNLTAVNGSYDLTQLNYAGTTVEVFGDNVEIAYSRIFNGRTVLRVFGDETDATKVINVNVNNSVLSGAREFILRMGSNCFVNGTKDNFAPYIDGQRNLIEDKKNYNAMSAADKQAYDSKYIKTFVTVSNTTFRDAGIFAIGIDTHFAGRALQDGTQYGSILGEAQTLWQNLAKTSYGAKLILSGDVKLYNWKPVDQIDSSTLIEITGSTQWNDMLEFDVGAMVELASQKDGFGTIVKNYNGTAYVHAGIAFFGGGRNYGVLEDLTKNGEGLGLDGFDVSLAIVEKAFLASAAGPENFYFNIYDSRNENGNQLFREQFGL